MIPSHAQGGVVTANPRQATHIDRNHHVFTNFKIYKLSFAKV